MVPIPYIVNFFIAEVDDPVAKVAILCKAKAWHTKKKEQNFFHKLFGVADKRKSDKYKKVLPREPLLDVKRF